MDSPAIVAYSLAFIVVAGVGLHVIGELRQRAIQRAHDRLQRLAQEGEAVASLPESDVRSRCQWGESAAELVRRFHAPLVAEEFAVSVADLLVGAEALEQFGAEVLEQYGRRQRSPEERRHAWQQRCSRGVTEGVRWLHLRAATVGPGDLKGRLWWRRR